MIGYKWRADDEHFTDTCSCGERILECACDVLVKNHSIIAFGCEACKARIALATQEIQRYGTQAQAPAGRIVQTGARGVQART